MVNLAKASDASLFALFLSSSALILASSAASDFTCNFAATVKYCCEEINLYKYPKSLDHSHIFLFSFIN